MRRVSNLRFAHLHTHPCLLLTRAYVPQAIPSVNSTDDFNWVAAVFAFHCVNSTFDEGLCTGLSKQVALSMDYNLARRPAAVCSRLGVCDPTLSCTSAAGTPIVLDMCSVNGLAGGAAVRPNGEIVVVMAHVVCIRSRVCIHALMCFPMSNVLRLCHMSLSLPPCRRHVFRGVHH